MRRGRPLAMMLAVCQQASEGEQLAAHIAPPLACPPAPPGVPAARREDSGGMMRGENAVASVYILSL